MASTPARANTHVPASARAAATSSWVDSGFEAARKTRAPPARRAPTRPAVSAVTCRQAAAVSPANGCSPAKRSVSSRSTGMPRCAQPIRARPASARFSSAMSDGRPYSAAACIGSVAVVIRLVRPLHRDTEVAGLRLGQLGEPDAEGVQVQPGHLLVQVLGQDVYAGPVVLRPGEQLYLRDHLVGEGVGHHETRVAGRV